MSQNDAAAVPQLTLTGNPVLYDRRGYPRSACTLPSFRTGVPPANKGQLKPAEVYTPDEMYRLLEVFGEHDHAIRDKSVIVAMWRAGLRITEALNLQPKDIDWENGNITVMVGKGGKRRVTTIDPGGLAYLSRWRERRSELGFGPGPLHCVLSGPSKGMRMGGAYLRIKMKEKGLEAKIDKSMRPHCCRHSYASFHSEQRTPILMLSKTLGHSNVAITHRYIDHVAPWAVLDVMRAVEWPEPPPSRI